MDRDPYYYTRRVKEAIHIRLHPNNINSNSGIEIPEAWMPTTKKHNNRRAMRQRTAKGANHWVNSKDWNAPIRAVEKTTNHSRASCFITSRMTSQPHGLKKTSSMQSKRCDLHHTWLHRETNEKLSFLLLKYTEVYFMVSMAFLVALYLMNTNGVESWWHCCFIWVKVLNIEITDNVIAFNCRNAKNLSLSKISCTTY